MRLHAATAAALLSQILFEAGVGVRGAAVAAAVVLAAARMFAPGAGMRPLAAPVVAASVLFTSLAVHAAKTPAPRLDDVTSLLGADGRSPSVVRLVADVVEPPRPSPTGASTLIAARELRAWDGSRRRIGGRVLLSIRHAHGRLRPGQRIELRTRLRRIASYGNPGEFDYARWSARRGVRVSGFVWDERDVELLGASPDVSALTRMRAAVAEAARGSRGAAGALTAALVVGDRALDPAVLEDLRRSGLFHLLAISGMNVGAVAAFVLWLSLRAGAAAGLPASGRDPVRLPAVSAAAAVCAYAALSGGGESVVRATVMALLMLGALWRGRRGDAWRALSVAALLLAAASPGSPADVGFQLSFAATAAVLVAVRVVEGLAWPRVLRAVVGAMAISLLCWLVTAPIVAQHFHRVSLVAPLASLAAALPSSIVVLAGLAGASLLAPAPRLADLAFDVAALGGEAILWAARTAASPAWAEHIVVAPGNLLAACAAGLPLALGTPGLRRRRLAAVLCAAALACVAVAAWSRYRADRLDAVFVSVGQGDATVVRLPGGRVLVVDAGPPGRGRTAVGPLLRRMRIGRIDVLVLTHAQDDHWGGARELADELAIGELWIPGGRCRSQAFTDFVAASAARGTRVVEVGPVLARKAARGRLAPSLVRRGAEGWRIRALWPLDADGACDANDRSVVVSVAFAGERILLAGDIEERAERSLALAGELERAGRAGRRRRLAATVLKVPHHGSRTSSTPALLAAVSPRIAVASMGVANRYGFPHADVVARYAEHGIELFRTDRDGAVRIVVDRTRVAAAPTRTRAASSRAPRLRQRVD